MDDGGLEVGDKEKGYIVSNGADLFEAEAIAWGYLG